MTDEVDDFRSELQKREEAEESNRRMMTKAQRIAKRLDDLLKHLHHQVKHNAPIGPALVKEIEAIRAEIG